MVKLILIRHAESVANSNMIIQGQKIDEPLSELGEIQAKKTAKIFNKKDIVAIISSDLKRALHTANEISKVLHKNIKIDKRLRERNHNNEENEVFILRCKSFLEDIKNYTGTVIAVAHGGTNKTILAISTGDRIEGAKIFNTTKQYNACINILSYKKKWVIQSINDVSHLDILEITKQKNG
ncbi:histidine phosphatase family protein [Candidatus Woesearchaeota archaeon]|nr:MAG: alpha-ribazole phosphatase [archaeon GW2011_AR18]MBS3161735.1 histidine phosphatase family protein [Candidatus Woesearchaeota archaeon]HIH26309.1 histidine phosphatase family protein [Nanoarchaeota archaeon]